jgi:CubicO group peptidase (beta-lactamase class C family)
VDGELVVDAWSGLADPDTDRPVDGDTLFTVFSVGKGIAATAVHLLAQRGLLDYDTPVCRYWPEFRAHGKAAITVRHVLCHAAGIPQLPAGVTIADVCDWDRICQAIAELEPLWEPGTQTGYHATTWGFVVGELIRRADGRPFSRVVVEDICRPLGIDTIFFGIPDAVGDRVARLEDGIASVGQAVPAPDSLVERAMGPVPRRAAIWNRSDIRRACIPAAGGIMNARAIARHYAALACGELDGVSLLSPERVRTATTLQTDARDAVVGLPLPKALGYFLAGPGSEAGGRATAFGHAGTGGMAGFADPTYRFSFALTKNRLVPPSPGEATALRVARAVRQALAIPET